MGVAPSTPSDSLGRRTEVQLDMPDRVDLANRWQYTLSYSEIEQYGMKRLIQVEFYGDCL